MNHPIEASADGKRNAFAFHCDKLGQRRSYAVCLHLCEERKKGRLDIRYSDCSAYIGKKECPALRMRKEEIAEGRGIYFEERIIAVSGFMEKAKEFVSKAVSAVVPQPVEKKRESVASSIERAPSGTYADALNNALSGASAETKGEPQPVAEKQEAKPNPGESLLDMARRLMGANK